MLKNLPHSLKILHIIPNLRKGGAERLCLDIVRYLNKKEGILVKLAVLNHINEYTDEYPEIQPTVLTDKIIPSITSSWKVNYEDYNRLITTFKPDIVHTHLFEADFFVHYKVYPNIKYVTHCHDNIHQLSRFKFTDIIKKIRIVELYEKQCLFNKYKSCNNEFIAVSEDTQLYLKSVLPNSLLNNIHYLPNAIDTSRFISDNKTNTLKSPIRLINIGSFIPVKNQKFLVDVMLELNKINIKAELLLIGDGILKNEVMAYAKEKKVVDQIKFLGKINKVENYIKESDIYIHSSLSESFGLVLIEAMAGGLPVVSINGKGNKELIENGYNGYIQDETNPRLFAEKIITLVNNQGRYSEMSANAIEYAKKYDIKNYVDKLLSIYKSKISVKSLA